MDHLEFINKLNELGLAVRSTNYENEGKIVQTDSIDTDLCIKGFEVKYVMNSAFPRSTPLQTLIKEGIDIDTYKHSSDYGIIPKNYELFRDIIQNKILRRAVDIDKLLTVYLQLNHEIVEENNKLKEHET